MKKLMRYVPLLALAAILALSPALTALAQGPDQVYCNGLSDADCALLTDSQTAMQNVYSLSIPAWSFEMNMDAGKESVSMAANGSATAMLAPAVVAWISDLPQVVYPADVDTVMSILDKVDSTLIQEALTGSVLQFALDQFTLDAPDQQMTLSADLILKDGAVFAGLTSPSGAKTWFGQTFKLSPSDLAELDQALADMRDQVQTALDDAQFTDTMGMAEQFSGMSADLTALVNKHVVTTRGADQTVDGVTVAVFTTTFDPQGLLADPELPGLLLDMLKDPAFQNMMSQMDSTLDLQVVNEAQVRLVLMTASMLLTDASFSTEQWIGVDDHYLYRTSATMSMALDLALFAGQQNAADNPGTVESNLAFDVQMADFNAVTPDSVTIPQDYFSFDKMNDYLVGDPSQIEKQLEIGQTVSGTFDYASTPDLYGLALSEGNAIEVMVGSSDRPDLTLYAPDGFKVAKAGAYSYEPLQYTADQDGTYVLSVSGAGPLEYNLGILLAQ